MRPAAFLLLAGALGVISAIVKLVTMFLPLLLWADIAVFGALGYLLGRVTPRLWLPGALLLAGPSFLYCVRIAWRVRDRLGQGIGIAWWISIVSTLGLALVGAYIGSRISGRRITRAQVGGSQ